VSQQAEEGRGEVRLYRRTEHARLVSLRGFHCSRPVTHASSTLIPANDRLAKPHCTLPPR